jgi:hypothetical protein
MSWPLTAFDYTRYWALPLVLGIGGLIPGPDLLLFSGHGGLGWFILPFAIPIATFCTVRAAKRDNDFQKSRKAANVVVVVGSAATIALLFLAEKSIQEWLPMQSHGMLPALASLLGIPFVLWSMVSLHSPAA